MHKSGIIKLSALAMAAVSVLTMASCALTDSAEEEESTTERAVVEMEARPETQEQMLDFFNRAVNNIKTSRPGVSSETEYSINDIDTGDTAEAKALMQFAKQFSDALEDAEDSRAYGDDLQDFLPIKGTGTVSRLTMADVQSVELNDSEEDRYVYELVITLQDGEQAAQNAYDFEVDKTKVLETFSDFKDLLEVSDYEVTYTGCVIRATINKETDQVLWLRYERDANVEADVNFTGTLQTLGETTVKFRMHDTRTFRDFVWEKPTEEAAEDDMLLN